MALDLPDRVREQVSAWQRREVDPIPTLRATRRESLHVTLAFLGPRRESDAGRVAALLPARDLRAPRLRFEREPVGVPGGRPRIFALEAEGEEAISFRAGLERDLVAKGLFEPEERPFWPHVTIARVRPERRGSKKPARVTIPPAPLPDELLEPFCAVRVRLYRSLLRPHGAEYVPLASTDLKVSG